jgi:hypothetical protein
MACNKAITAEICYPWNGVQRPRCTAAIPSRQCRTRVKPGLRSVPTLRPLRGRKRNSQRHSTMSQKCQQRKSALSFDHLVGTAEQLRRYFEAERLRGGEIDEELELGRLYDRQVSRFVAIENAGYI